MNVIDYCVRVIRKHEIEKEYIKLLIDFIINDPNNINPEYSEKWCTQVR
jgi:hypothetical protein